MDVAVTGVNGQSRRSDTETDQPLEYRCKQKKDKYTQGRAILAVATKLVDKVNSTPPTASSSDQCDDIINANHESAQRFMEMEDMELAVLNQDHTQI